MSFFLDAGLGSLYEPNPAFANYDPFNPLGDKPPSPRAKRQQKRRERHRRHPDLLKMRVLHRGFDDLLEWQEELWQRFIDQLQGIRLHDFQGGWGATATWLVQCARFWERPEEASTAHVKWLAMTFAKRAFKLGQMPAAGDCPDYFKVCEKIRLNREMQTIKVPCIATFSTKVHDKSRKSWSWGRGRHPTSVSIRKVKKRWVVLVHFRPESQVQDSAQQVSYSKISKEETLFLETRREDTCCADPAPSRSEARTGQGDRLGSDDLHRTRMGRPAGPEGRRSDPGADPAAGPRSAVPRASRHGGEAVGPRALEAAVRSSTEAPLAVDDRRSRRSPADWVIL